MPKKISTDNLSASFAGLATKMDNRFANKDEINSIESLLINNASKNLLPLTLQSIKSINQYGTWSDNVYTIYGVTFTINTNDAGYVTSIVVNRISNSDNDAYLFLINGTDIVFANDNYILNGVSGSSPDTYYIKYISPDWNHKTVYNNDELMNVGAGISRIRFDILTSCNINNVIFYPMVRRKQITDNIFEPYYRTQKQLDTDLSTAENNIIETKDYIGYTDSDIYGLEVDYENELSTRLAASVDKTGGADFDNTTAWGGRRRCNLTDNGVVTAYYGDEAYTETGVLTQAVTVNGTEYPIGTAVQVMVEQPKFYYKVVPLKLESYTTQNGDTGYHIRKAAYYIADTPKDGFKLHPAFIRNGAEKEKIYLSAYEGCLYDTSASTYITDDAQVADFNADKMSSIANVKPMSGLTQNLTRANARKLAQNRGIGWEQMYIHTASATQLLFMIEYGTLNSQQAIGNGVVSKADGTGNESENTGGTSSLGNTSGSISNSEISYRGEENVWGNIWKWEDGINIKNPNPFNNNEYGNVYVADNGFSDNTNSLPYENTNIYPCKANSIFVTAFGYDKKFDWLFIPTEAKGGLYSLLCDMYWNSQIGWTFSTLGGRWSAVNQAGAFEYGMNIDSLGYSRTISGRLVYVPDANESNRSLKQIDEDLTGIDTLLTDNACKNLFDYNKWKETISIYWGTGVFENYGVTLIAQGNDCQTSGDKGILIPVESGKQYTLTWSINESKSNYTDNGGLVYIFLNGNTNSGIGTNATDKEFIVMIPNNVTTIRIRFGVAKNGETIAYENIMLRRAEITDDTFEPYYDTQKQLYERILALEARLAALENNSGDGNDNTPLLEEDEEVVEKPDVGN